MGGMGGWGLEGRKGGLEWRGVRGGLERLGEIVVVFGRKDGVGDGGVFVVGTTAERCSPSSCADDAV